MTRKEKIEELLKIGVRKEVISDQEMVKKIKRLEKRKKIFLWFLLPAGFLSVLFMLLEYSAGNETEAKILEYFTLLIFVTIFIVIVGPIKKKHHKPLVGRLGET